MSNIYVERVFWLIYIIAVIIGTEVFAYFWHRYGAHTNYIPGIYDTHVIHHMSSLEHEADEDFVWILLLMIIFELIMGIGVMINLVPARLAIVTIIVSLCIFWWNWWIHSAYHNKDHWLNYYDWFITEKDRHYIHHRNPCKNYGIASHFTDRLMGTWIEPITNIELPDDNIQIE